MEHLPFKHYILKKVACGLIIFPHCFCDLYKNLLPHRLFGPSPPLIMDGQIFILTVDLTWKYPQTTTIFFAKNKRNAELFA
jgi:hypothetical protein